VNVGTKIADVVNKYKDLYLKKSKTTEEDWDHTSKMHMFNAANIPNVNEGWFTYCINRKDSIFSIGSLFHAKNDKHATDRCFVFLKQLAKKEGCKKIVFYTSRNGKIWERRFNDMKTTGWRMEVKL